ncbi:hypothetical protein LTR37_008974 [Vermiconidia calcicola]|uniref:Uncharacterized protein n=1 Tax=Vermiconidia calcicola TaxID=1690605 RepID=A0ACC3NAE4_9PEZI|nr:hypothetical protein LTR37_008974 [Vermiconidia calcicola]
MTFAGVSELTIAGSLVFIFLASTQYSSMWFRQWWVSVLCTVHVVSKERNKAMIYDPQMYNIRRAYGRPLEAAVQCDLADFWGTELNAGEVLTR